MAAAASSAELAVLLIDARKGLLTQTRCHSQIIALLGIHDVIVVVNKMDMVAWKENEFERIKNEYLAFATRLGFTSTICIPVSALHGHNVTRRSDLMFWYRAYPARLS